MPPLLSRFSSFNVKFLVIRHLSEVCLLSQWGEVESIRSRFYRDVTICAVCCLNLYVCHYNKPFAFSDFLYPLYRLAVLRLWFLHVAMRSISGLPFFLLLHPKHLTPACTPKGFSTLSYNRIATACQTNPLWHLYLLTFVQGVGMATLVRSAFWILTMLTAIHLRWAYASFQSP